MFTGTSNYTKHDTYLGPLHTQAKSRDHEIVRAQKKVSKGCRSQHTSKIV